MFEVLLGCKGVIRRHHKTRRKLLDRTADVLVGISNFLR